MMDIELNKAARELMDAMAAPQTRDSMYATVSSAEGAGEVVLDGASEPTPVAFSYATFHYGDRVLCRVEGHRLVVTANVTDPSASSTDYEYVKDRSDAVDDLLDGVAEMAEAAGKTVAEILDDGEKAGAAATRAEAAAGRAEDAAGQAADTLDGMRQAAQAAGTTLEGIYQDAKDAEVAAESVQNHLKNVVRGATTVEKAVSVMQTALESVVDYDPNTTAETFTGDGAATDYALQSEATDVLGVTVGGEPAEYTSAVVGGVTVITFAEAPASGAEISVTYEHATVQEWFWHDANGAHVLGDASGYRNDIDSSGMNIKQVSTEDSVARFGVDGWQVGLDDESHTVGDYHSLQLIDKDGIAYFHVSDFRDADGYATIQEFFYADGTTATFGLQVPLEKPETAIATINSSPATIIETTLFSVTLETTPNRLAQVVITYQTKSGHAKAYTLGERRALSVLGCKSTAEGTNVVASGFYSHAEGDGSSAIGKASHAEGKSEARGDYSHSEGHSAYALGEYSHAEGQGRSYGKGSHAEGDLATYAYGDYSHAEGIGSNANGKGAHAEGHTTYAYGDYSHSQNYRTKASSNYQTALGKYNEEDANGTYAAIIGNGTAANARSDALRVDWDGNVLIGGDVQDLSGNKLYADASEIDLLKDRLIYSDTWTATAMQARDGNTLRRLQLNGPSGNIQRYTSTDDGANWTFDGNIGINVNTNYLSGTFDNIATTNGMATQCAKIAIPSAGVWLIVAGVSFPSNATGSREIGISTNGTSLNFNRQSLLIVQASANTSTSPKLTAMQRLSAGDHYIMARQRSGGAMTISGHWNAIKLCD